MRLLRCVISRSRALREGGGDNLSSIEASASLSNAFDDNKVHLARGDISGTKWPILLRWALSVFLLALRGAVLAPFLDDEAFLDGLSPLKGLGLFGVAVVSGFPVTRVLIMLMEGGM